MSQGVCNASSFATTARPNSDARATAARRQHVGDHHLGTLGNEQSNEVRPDVTDAVDDDSSGA